MGTIIISLGNIGSGKTACMVREMFLNKDMRTTYSNILTKGLKFNKAIDPSMIIKRTLIDIKHKRDGSSEEIFKLELNKEYWQKVKEPVNVIIDEAHSIINARKARSPVNIVVSDWIALMRRVLGEDATTEGELVFITQLPRRIDVIAREMAHQVRYHTCHYIKTCEKCGTSWSENSDMPEKLKVCPYCGNFRMRKHTFQIEVWHFKGMDAYIGWKDFGLNSYYKHYFVRDIEYYFQFYETLQWDNLFSEYY